MGEKGYQGWGRGAGGGRRGQGWEGGKVSWKDDICWEVLSAHRAPEAQASLAPRSWPADGGQVRTAREDPGWRLKRGLMSRKTPD